MILLSIEAEEVQKKNGIQEGARTKDDCLGFDLILIALQCVHVAADFSGEHREVLSHFTLKVNYHPILNARLNDHPGNGPFGIVMGFGKDGSVMA